MPFVSPSSSAGSEGEFVNRVMLACRSLKGKAPTDVQSLRKLDPITGIAEQASFIVPNNITFEPEVEVAIQAVSEVYWRTIERVRLASSLAAELKCDLYLVGSVAYGSFFSIRAHSDLDLVYLADDFGEAIEELAAAGLDSGFTSLADFRTIENASADNSMSGLVLSSHYPKGTKKLDLRVFLYERFLEYVQSIYQQFSTVRDGPIGHVAELRTADDLKGDMEDVSADGSRVASLMIAHPLNRVGDLYLSNSYFGRWYRHRFYLGPFGNILFPRIVTVRQPTMRAESVFGAVRDLHARLMNDLPNFTSDGDFSRALYRRDRIRPDLRALYSRGSPATTMWVPQSPPS